MSKNRDNDHQRHDNREKIKSALIAVFPNLGAYQNFVDDDRGQIEIFLSLAREYGLIGENDGQDQFKIYVLENSLKDNNLNPPDNMGLIDLLGDRMKIKNSIRGLTEWINELIIKLNLGQLMPGGKVSNVMLSRLQREPANTINKRNTLRLLAFWFGYSRSYLGPMWNFETLVKLCPMGYSSDSKQGVRIAFDLYSKRDIIEISAVKWLKSELTKCIKELSLTRHHRFHSFSTTSICLDLPKENPGEEDLDHPRSYGRPIKDAISMAHQISVRWALSRYSSPKRMLTIGIAAGELSTLDIYLQSIIRTRISTDPVIRMTDFAHLCVLVNDIRAVFCETPKEIEVANGETITVWWVMGLWNTNFWGLVPRLLKDEMLQKDLGSEQKFMKMLWFGYEMEGSKNNREANAVASFLKTPQNSFLGLEVARTLYFRRRFMSADEILRIILSADPANLPARTLRMEIYWILGIEAPAYSISEIHFRQAEKEAALIDEICTTRIEDYFCEYGLGKIGHALTILRLIQKGGGRYEEKDIILKKEKVFHLLDEAKNLFEMGMTLSSRGHRSYYFLIFTLSLQRILIKDQEIFNDPDREFLDRHGVVNETAIDIYYAIGWLSREYPIKDQFPDFVNFLLNAISGYGESILLKTSIPNVKYSFASILWDFFPMLNIGIAKTVLKYLYDAYKVTERLGDEDLCLFSTIRCHKEVLHPEIFINFVQRAINEVESRVGTLSDLEKRRENEPIDIDKIGGLKLFCLNI